ncbi:MAG: nucleoid-associated protein [Cellulosilyticaceae bacterium]
MSILYNKSIMHLLDKSLDFPLLSSELLHLTDETEAFITNYIVKLLESMSVSQSLFTEQSQIGKMFVDNTYVFEDFSNMLAKSIFQEIVDDSTIPSGDLIVVDFKKDGIPYVGFFKLNYKEAFTHLVDQSDSGPMNTVIKHRTIFPDSVSKIQEACLINKDSLSVFLLDTSRSKYLQDLIGISASLTVKEKIKVAEHVINEAIDENFENKIEAKSFAKNNIAKSIQSSSSIMLDAILEETFQDQEELVASCLKKCESYGLTEKVIDLPSAESTYKKYHSSKLKTNTGIEIKLPSEMLHDPNLIEFINNPDGTLSIVLKNIAELINK